MLGFRTVSTCSASECSTSLASCVINRLVLGPEAPEARCLHSCTLALSAVISFLSWPYRLSSSMKAGCYRGDPLTGLASVRAWCARFLSVWICA
jgi:hypothetical protein